MTVNQIPTDSPFKLNYGPEIEPEIGQLIESIQAQPALAHQFPVRWLAVKLLEHEPDLIERVRQQPGGPVLIAAARQSNARIESRYGDSADIAIADARYGFIHGLARQVVEQARPDQYTLTDRIDRIVTHRLLGLPLFLLVMYIMFKLVVDVSAPYVDWVDGVISGPFTRWAAALLRLMAAPDWLRAMVVDGIIAGVGGVLVFVPGLVVLYFFLTLLEDSGYLARAAFLMDKVMSFTGLHGKSFIPLILGFGCAVPAIYATRTLENERDRIATALLVPLMSCSARLPVYVVFGLAFFPAQAGLLITGLYLTGIAAAMVIGSIFSRTLLRNNPDRMFVLELPPYRLPHFKGLLLHTWEKSKEFVHKAGTVILTATVVFWFAMHLPWGVDTARQSLFGRASAAIAPIFAPAGFGEWEAAGSLMTGFIAKEVVVSTMAQIFLHEAQADEAVPATFGQDMGEVILGFGTATVETGQALLSMIPGLKVTAAAEESNTALSAALAARYSQAAALAFLVFVLIYTPCVATLGTIKAEFGWKWLALSASYQFGLAWRRAVVVYQAIGFLGWG